MAYLRMRTKLVPIKLQWERNLLIIKGEANIKTEVGVSYFIQSGDLVEFPEGFSFE